MPVYVQDEDYDEDFDVPVVDEDESQPRGKKDTSISESDPEPEDDDNEEEEQKPKPKKKKPVKKKKKRSSKNTAIIAGAAVGSTVLIAMIAIVGFKVANAKKAAEAKAEEDALYEQTARIYEYNEEMGNHDQTEAVEETEPSYSISYSSAEQKALRKWGYTASELEIASRGGLSAQALVDSARADREEAQKEALAAVSDTASDEYKKLLNQTWLGGEPLDVSQFTSEYVYDTQERTEIADFEKCDPHGQQCFIKVYLDNGNAAFMQVTPQRFNELPDSGNMVVVIDDVTLNDVTVITNIYEQRVN